MDSKNTPELNFTEASLPASVPAPIPAAFRMSLKRMLTVIAFLSVALLPMAYNGWQGVYISVVFTLAVISVFFSRPSWAYVILLIGISCWMAEPALQGARPAFQRTRCCSNMRQIAIAIHNYESDHGELPPPFSVAADGTPLHSWRVLILPYLEQQSLYEQIDLSQPCDAPVNGKFHDMMPDVYCCPTAKYNSRWYTTGNTTAYVAVTGDDTAWPVKGGRTLLEVSQLDGIANTILIIESESHRAPWMSPMSPDISTFLQEMTGKHPHDTMFNLAIMDGSFMSMGNNFPTENLADLFRINDAR